MNNNIYNLYFYFKIKEVNKKRMKSLIKRS